MRGLALALLVACGGKDGGDSSPVTSTSGSTTTGSTTGTTTSTTRPELVSPAEATDLDADPDVLHVQLTAAPHEIRVGELTIDGYAYNGQVPGPTLRAKVGDELVVELTNDLDDPTTIHWHGVHVPWAMDGVTWMQDPVGPGETFEYRFTLEQVGTFWYHPHFDTVHQVDHGLYGVLVVEDPSEPAVAHDEVWVFDSWGEEAWSEGHVHTPDPTARTWTINGLVWPEFVAGLGDQARVRVLNASNAGYLALDADEVIARDQGLLAAAASGLEVVGPGDRVELLLALGPESRTLSSQPYSAAGGEAWGEPIPLVDVRTEGATGAGGASFSFSGELPSADPGWTDVRWSLNGGTGAADSWTINGEAFPNVTVPELPVDRPAVIELRNLSGAEHPFHVHGMSFEVLSVDGVAPATKTVEDTVNVRIGEIVRLLVRPPRAGDWMAHCHILPHAEGGMMTVLSVQP